MSPYTQCHLTRTQLIPVALYLKTYTHFTDDINKNYDSAFKT